MSECYLAFTETPLRPNVSAQHIYAKGLKAKHAPMFQARPTDMLVIMMLQA